MCVQEEGKPVKAPKVPKRPGTAYTLFVKEKYSSISDTLPANERNVGMVGPGIVPRICHQPTSVVVQQSDPVFNPTLTREYHHPGPTTRS